MVDRVAGYCERSQSYFHGCYAILTHPIVAVSCILVVLVHATKKLEQQHHELSKIANARSCFLITLPRNKYFWAAGYYTQPLMFV